MNLWKRAAGLLKDQRSIWLTSFSRRTVHRNPDIEVAVIKSTSHSDLQVDYRNAQRVFAWVRVSPAYLRPLLCAITMRIDKTRSWVVALKGLMLMHGIFCCKVPGVMRIERLPFDLSSFKDEHSKPGERWGHDTFIRAYYLFLARKSSFLYEHTQEKEYKGLQRKDGTGQEDHGVSTSMMEYLVWLQEMQDLLDILLEIKPSTEDMVGTLILEAMDCIMIEIFDVYSRICSGISAVLIQIYSLGKDEASMGLRVLRKANTQGKQLCLYFELCRKLGVNNAANCPGVKQISEEDLRMLEHIMRGMPIRSDEQNNATTKERPSSMMTIKSRIDVCEQDDLCTDKLQTKVTQQWEAFDKDHSRSCTMGEKVALSMEEHSMALSPLIDIHDHFDNKEFPNLISL